MLAPDVLSHGCGLLRVRSPVVPGSLVVLAPDVLSHGCGLLRVRSPVVPGSLVVLAPDVLSHGCGASFRLWLFLPMANEQAWRPGVVNVLFIPRWRPCLADVTR